MWPEVREERWTQPRIGGEFTVLGKPLGEGAMNVHNTAIRRALSPLRPCGSVTADVHG